HTLSSAMRTCMASVSAVEWTATDLMPISRAARITLRAISPRLAISILSNIANALFDYHQRRAKFDSAAILDEDAFDGAAARGGDMVHRFHRLDDQQRVAFDNRVTDRHKGGRTRFGLRVNRADHGRG